MPGARADYICVNVGSGTFSCVLSVAIQALGGSQVMLYLVSITAPYDMRLHKVNIFMASIYEHKFSVVHRSIQIECYSSAKFCVVLLLCIIVGKAVCDLA